MFSPAHGDPWKSVLPTASGKSYSPIFVAFVTIVAELCLGGGGLGGGRGGAQVMALLLGEDKPVFSNRTGRLPQKQKIYDGVSAPCLVHLRRVPSLRLQKLHHKSGGKNLKEKRRKKRKNLHPN